MFKTYMMNNINLNKLRNRVYKTACEHGFHDKELSNEHHLCLIISELMEAVEADRKGKRADRESFKSSYEDEAPTMMSISSIVLKNISKIRFQTN